MKCSLNVQFIYNPTSSEWQYTVCKYATEILEWANMVGCNSSRTPVDTESELGDGGDPVCLYMDDPWEPHFSALKRILSAEVEYHSVANAVAETCWLRNLLREFHTPLFSVMLVYSYNVSVVCLSSNPVQHQRTKIKEVKREERMFARGKEYKGQWDQVSILEKDVGFGHEMHYSEEFKAFYGITPPRDYAVTYFKEEMSHHTFYGVKLLSLYAATFKFTRDDLSESALRRNIGDKENVIIALVMKWLDDVDINPLTMEKYLARLQDDIRPGVVKHKIGNDIEFEINSNFMRELRCKIFKGTDDEDAHEHGPALRWINRLSAGLVTTWDLFEESFIRQYCPPLKTAKKLEEIHNFKQEVDKPLYRAWERYSNLLYRCPQHDLNSQQRVHIFYTRLYIPTRIMLDSKGFIPLMTPTQALKSIQVIADHSRNWYDEATTKEIIKGSLDDVDIKQLDENIHVFQVSSKTCEGVHLTEECTLRKEDKAVEQYNPSRTHEIVCMMGILKEIHKMKAQEDEGNTDDGPVHDKEKVAREKEQDYDIPLQDHVMQPLTPQTVHITPPDDNYVAPTTNPILNKHLNEFGEEFPNNTRVFEKLDSNPVNNLKELLKTYDFKTFIRKSLH
ncbi:integrase, catalytic region, zinc finger, CCHC-type containing protein [Tanacetum coccineum]